MRSLLRVLLFFAVTLATVGLAGPATTVQAQTQARYDGFWSVLIVTEAGTCDRAYRYGLRIAQGVVHYDGEAGVTMTGRVDRNGRVTVTLSRGQQSAQGSGRLSGDEGTGTWRGSSSTNQCSGYWEAERRGR